MVAVIAFPSVGDPQSLNVADRWSHEGSAGPNSIAKNKGTSDSPDMHRRRTNDVAQQGAAAFLLLFRASACLCKEQHCT
jgi:hypothetical protein